MHRLLIGREISWGAHIPRGWNMAWNEPRRRVAVYFPAPLHWFARVARDLQWRIQLAWNAAPQERHESGEMHRYFASGNSSRKNTREATSMAGKNASTRGLAR